MTFATILEKSWEEDRKTSNRPLARAEMPETDRVYVIPVVLV